MCCHRVKQHRKVNQVGVVGKSAQKKINNLNKSYFKEERNSFEKD